MKFLVLFLATAAVAAASFVDVNKYGLNKKQGVDSIYGQGYNGIYAQYPKWNQFWNKNIWQQKYGRGVFDNQEVYGKQGLFNQESTYGSRFYGQDVQELLWNVLFRIFDKQVWVNIFNQYGYQQNWNQNVWDEILADQGIFDREVLVQLIKNPVVRNILVQEGIFDRTVLEQILYTFNIQGSYNQVLFDQLVNRVAVRNWLYNLGFYNKDTLYQFFYKRIYENTFNSNEYGQEWLIQVVNNPELRKYLVEQGVFNEDILKQFLYLEKSQGVHYGEYLLKQVINKQFLKSFFIQHGFVEYNVLNQLLSNEIFGLKVFLRVQFFQQIPEFFYRQPNIDRSYNPEYVFDYDKVTPVGDNFVGIDVRKTIVTPIKQNFGDELFQNKRYQPTKSGLNNGWTYKGDQTSNLWNTIVGQQGNEFNDYFNNVYWRQGVYNRLPIFDY